MTNQKNNLSHDQQTVVALCTPQGPGALALIRLSGDNAVEIADKMAAFPVQKKLADMKTHTIHYGWVIDEKAQHIDQVLFLLMHGPRTFTGQDVIEITSHNNQFVIEKIIDRAIACGARLAARGEFAQRAVQLGKMDLVQAEAMNDLIHAQTAEATEYSLKQLEGSLSSWLQEAEQKMIHMMAFCEASFEFIDEEDMEFSGEVLDQLNQLLVKVSALLKTYPKQQYIKEGIRIALVGAVNAGKSSLFNALLEKERAIVTEVAGTTRDTIESGLYKQGLFLTLVDTAGLRETDDAIEKQGIDRSFDAAKEADIIVLVVDRSRAFSSEELEAYKNIIIKYQNKTLFVANKSDQKSVAYFDVLGNHKWLHVSAQNNQNIAVLHEAIDAKIQELKGSDSISCLLNKRQHTLLASFLDNLNSIKPMLEQESVDYELVVYKLREALQLLAEMTGRSVSEATMNQVFQSFCVGK